MRKSTKMLKKLAFLFLVVLMSINTLGAMVSDNDGAAFITKAEFDSLKNDFNSQIDQYNRSIDSKIDGAIASYLAGIKVSKTLVLKNLINNISDIKWVNNFYIYGTWKKWTSNSTSTQNLTKSWFVPSGAEERAHVRGTGQMIWDTSSYAWSYYIMSIYADAQTGQYTNILPYADGKSYADEVVPVFGLNMVQENDMWLLSNANPITNMSAFQAYHPGNEQNWGVGTDAHLWKVGQYMAVIDSVDFNVAKNSGDFIAYSLSGHSTRPTPDTFNWTSHLTSERANEPVVFQGWAIKDGSSLSLDIPSRTNAVTGKALDYLKDNTYFSKGCTWHSVATGDRTNLGRCINYYMLGNDNNDKYNLFRFTNEYFGEGIRVDVSGTDASKTFSCPVDIKSWTFTQLPYGGSREDGIKRTELTTPIPFTIDYPNYPQASLSEIPTRHFEYNGNKLKMGQGIPLVIDNVAGNGYIHLTFDADDMELMSNTHKSYKFNIDIKKSDFLQSNKTDYVDVYEGLVDPNSTTKTLKECKRLSYDATTDGGKVELTVPIKNEESLWFRIAPENTSTGRYCKTENLNIKLIIE